MSNYNELNNLINEVDPIVITDNVLTVHLEKIKNITKSFIDAG